MMTDIETTENIELICEDMKKSEDSKKLQKRGMQHKIINISALNGDTPTEYVQPPMERFNEMKPKK